MKFNKLVLLLALFSESNHSLKDYSNSPYQKSSLRGYIATLTQLFLPIFFTITSALRLTRRYTHDKSSRRLLLLCPLNKSIKSSQYFFRFIDCSSFDVHKLYVQTNSPSPFSNIVHSSS